MALEPSHCGDACVGIARGHKMPSARNAAELAGPEFSTRRLFIVDRPFDQADMSIAAQFDTRIYKIMPTSTWNFTGRSQILDATGAVRPPESIEPLLKLIRRFNIPVTRQNYLDLAYMGQVPDNPFREKRI